MESSFKAVRRPESNRVPFNWNIAPSQDVLRIRFNPKTGLPAAPSQLLKKIREPRKIFAARCSMLARFEPCRVQ